jgi:hypothetical protein
MASVGGTSSLAFAGVFAFAIVVRCLTAPLPLTLVLALTRVFTFLSVVHRLETDACIAGGTRGVGAYSGGPGQQSGNGRSSNHCFGWFHYALVSFFGVASILGFPQRLHYRGGKAFRAARSVGERTARNLRFDGTRFVPLSILSTFPAFSFCSSITPSLVSKNRLSSRFALSNSAISKPSDCVIFAWLRFLV